MKSKFFQRYLSSKVLPIWTILLIDVFIIVVSCMLSYALRYDFRSIFLDSSTIDRTILWTVIINLVFFRVPYVLQRTPLLFLCGYYADLRISHSVIRSVDTCKRDFRSIHGCQGSTGECVVYGLYHKFCFDVLFTHCCEDAFRSFKF